MVDSIALINEVPDLIEIVPDLISADGISLCHPDVLAQQLGRYCVSWDPLDGLA